MFEKYNLVLIGSIGYDVYIVGENNKIIFSPGGFAWHSACGVFSINGKADILANITNGFNKELLSHFSESGVSLALNHSKDKFENAYIFDFSNSNYTIGISYSEGIPSLKFSELLNKDDDAPKLVHIGTTNPSTILDRIYDINSLGLRSVKFSSNLYLPYLNEKNLDYIKQIVSLSSIVFLNIDELNKLKELEELKLLEDKLLVVTCGKKGVAFFVKNNLKFTIPPKKRIEVSAIGAGGCFTWKFFRRNYQRVRL